MIKDVLPSDLLTSYFKVDVCKDQKLTDIGLYLKSLIFKGEEQNATMTEESKTAQSASQMSQAEAMKAKKDTAAKKKAAMLARMKKK